MASFVVGLPADPVIATTRRPHCRRTCVASDCNPTSGSSVISSGAASTASGNPATRGFTYEAFWTPVQYARIGLQYTAYNRFNGASSNYDGFGRNAKDNNTLFGYAWMAF